MAAPAATVCPSSARYPPSKVTIQFASVPGPVRLPSVPGLMKTLSPAGISRVTIRLRLISLQMGHWWATH
eukprot:4285405-Lingulodinium_polyedra.AAC.1